MKIRVGFGYDVHQLTENRELWLGGVLIPHDKGALGHSDADVLLHAICDALLGAAGKRDIGFYFPDTSSEFKNIDSKIPISDKSRVSPFLVTLYLLLQRFNLIAQFGCLHKVEFFSGFFHGFSGFPNFLFNFGFG
jgi:hypothetical protein